MVTLFNCFSFNEEWYLVEMALTIPPQEIEFDKIVVPEEGVNERDWQTVLAEQFLNDNGTDSGDSDSRVAFFIYKTNSHVLRTPYGQFDLNDSEEVPDRLKDIIEIDDDYM